MDNLNVYFSKFVNILMKIFLIPLCFVILGNAINYSRYAGKYTIVIALIYIISAYFFYFLYKKRISTKKILFFILLYGLALRVAWVILVPTYPVSDFLGMYNAGEKILNGDTSMFKGTAYFARFTHMAMTVLFYTILRFFFGEPLIAIKIFNIISSLTTVYFCYLIAKELFKCEGKALIATFIAAIFPAFISYSS
ncbi:MAG: ArnT family glycosyltransferase, partial [Sarcina sp.]